MTRRSEAVDRLVLSRQRLQQALAGDEGVSTAGALLQQVVRHHPWACAAGAAALGALLARWRPWRWLRQPELWQALVPGLLGLVAATPAGSWNGLLATFLQQMAAAGPPAPAASAGADPPR